LHPWCAGGHGLYPNQPIRADDARDAKIPAPRAYLDGLDPNDGTGAYYADFMLETQILHEGGNRVGISCRTVAGPQLALVPPAVLERIREVIIMASLDPR
jgi:hypothetical protein